MRRLALVIVLASMFAVGAHAGDVAMMPTRVEISLKPGQDFTTVVNVMHIADNEEDESPLRVSMKTEDWFQDSWGRIEYASSKPGPESARPWVVFSPGEQQIPPGQTASVRVSVIVPDNAEPGEYRAALIAQPRTSYEPTAAGERRLDLQLRLASMIYVVVEPCKPGVHFQNLTVYGDKNHLYIEPHFVNTGAVHLRFFHSFELYSVTDSTQIKIFEGDREEAGVALPTSERFFYRELPGPLGPGRYKLVYRADVGDSLPIQEGETEFLYPLPEEYVKVGSAPYKPGTSRRTDSE
jgi:hypothetical protein